MIDGIPNRPLYFYQKDIIELFIIDWACRSAPRDYPLVN